MEDFFSSLSQLAIEYPKVTDTIITISTVMFMVLSMLWLAFIVLQEAIYRAVVYTKKQQGEIFVPGTKEERNLFRAAFYAFMVMLLMAFITIGYLDLFKLGCFVAVGLLIASKRVIEQVARMLCTITVYPLYWLISVLYWVFKVVVGSFIILFGLDKLYARRVSKKRKKATFSKWAWMNDDLVESLKF